MIENKPNIWKTVYSNYNIDQKIVFEFNIKRWETESSNLMFNRPNKYENPKTDNTQIKGLY